MPLIRLVIIAAVLWFAIRMVRRVMQAAAKRKTELGYRGRMVTCEVCGVYLPEHDAIERNGKFRCDAH